MALENDLKHLLDKSQAENDVVSRMRSTLAIVNTNMRQLFDDLDYHERCKQALAERLVRTINPQIAPPQEGRKLNNQSISEIIAGIQSEELREARPN